MFIYWVKLFSVIDRKWSLFDDCWRDIVSQRYCVYNQSIHYCFITEYNNIFLVLFPVYDELIFISMCVATWLLEIVRLSLLFTDMAIITDQVQNNLLRRDKSVQID